MIWREESEDRAREMKLGNMENVKCECGRLTTRPRGSETTCGTCGTTILATDPRMPPDGQDKVDRKAARARRDALMKKCPDCVDGKVLANVKNYQQERCGTCSGTGRVAK